MDLDKETWVKLYPKPFPHSFPLEANMAAAWERVVKEHRDFSIVQYYGTSFTVRDVDSITDALAFYLADEVKLTKGDRVAVFMQNIPEFVFTCIATWKVGGIVVNVNPMSREKELTHILRDSQAKVLVTQRDLYKSVARIVVPHCSSVVRVVTTTPSAYITHKHVLEEFSAVFAGVEPYNVKETPEDTEDFVEISEKFRNVTKAHYRLHYDVEPDDVACLTYTSGTTGPPKGAMNTHKNILFNAINTKNWFNFSTKDVVLTLPPLFHITGHVHYMATALVCPALIVLNYRFHPLTTAKLIERYRVTFAGGAITLYTALLNEPGLSKYDLSSWRILSSGGAPIAPATVAAVEKMFPGRPLVAAYGLTETAGASHNTPPILHDPVDPKTGYLAVGVPIPGIYSIVVDEHRKEVPVGEVGEIAIKGPTVIKGYWNLPGETKHAIDDNGFFYTGDIGMRDKNGWFYVIDRKKDLIIASGYKVWPKEVEDVLFTHPAVREAAVVGVPDKYRGETVKAFISLKANVPAPTPQQIIDFCKEKMAAYKYPRIVQIIDEVPKNLSGKVLRRELREAPPIPSKL